MYNPSFLTDVLKKLETAVEAIPIDRLPAVIGFLEQIKAAAWTRIHSATLKANRNEELLTVPEVAQRLKISPYRTYELLRKGEIKKTQLGKLVRVRLADLEEYIGHRPA